MKILLNVYILITAVVFLTPMASMAKLAIHFQQQVVYIDSQDVDGSLHAVNGEIFKINNKKTKLKAAEFIGMQSRILYYTVTEDNVGVDIAPLTDPPFDIAPISTRTSDRPL